MTGVRITITPGELLDRITILEVRTAHVRSPAALRELHALEKVWEKYVAQTSRKETLAIKGEELLKVNEDIWMAEDIVRLCMRAGEFGPMFVKAAREAHEKNDDRARLKAEINRLLGAPVEEKSYGGSNDQPE